MKKNRVCKYCNKQFELIEGKIFSNHVKWCEKNPNTQRKKEKCSFCSKEINFKILTIHEETCLLNPKNIKLCLECHSILKTNKNYKFCSNSCSAKYNNKHSPPNRTFGPSKGYRYAEIECKCDKCGKNFYKFNNSCKVNCDECEKIIKRTNSRIYRKLSSTCVICNEEFEYECRDVKKLKKTCSEKCRRKLMSNNSKNNPNCGGETNWKKFRYKDISMDSSWEVELATWMDENNIKWTRSRKIMFLWEDESGNPRRYYPDFLLPDYNLYLDPKNKYLMEKDAYKLNQVISKHKINLVCGSLDDIKNHVSSVVKI